jgi:uncharacterized protein
MELKNYTVDGNSKCRSCDYRYLCGGACLAWQKNQPGSRIDAPPPDCKAIKNKAKELYETALKELRILQEQ